jgi:PEP-CTERM motif
VPSFLPSLTDALRRACGALAVVALVPAAAMAAPINQGSYTLLAGSDVVTFNEVDTKIDFANLSSIGVSIDDILISGGVAFGEHFSGQLLSTSGNFDVPSGTPTGPLALQVGAPGENLFAATARVISLKPLQLDNVLSGVGQRSASSTAGPGEGAISILFSSDQSQFGLQLVGLNGGNTYFNFFREDGSLIQSFTERVSSNSYLGFFRDAGIKDIRGVTIWNDDRNGMAIDNVKHDVASSISAVPEPETYTLALAGLAAAGLMARKRRA